MVDMEINKILAPKRPDACAWQPAPFHACPRVQGKRHVSIPGTRETLLQLHPPSPRCSVSMHVGAAPRLLHFQLACGDRLRRLL